MKNYLIYISLCFIFSTQAQISYDFKVPLPPDGTQTASLNSSFFGTYTNSDSPVTYEINKDGIFIVSINVNSVSREMIRESSKYQVRNNHILAFMQKILFHVCWKETSTILESKTRIKLQDWDLKMC